MLQTLMNHPASLAEVLEAFTSLSVEQQRDVVAAVGRIDRKGGYSTVLRRLKELERRGPLHLDDADLSPPTRPRCSRAARPERRGERTKAILRTCRPPRHVRFGAGLTVSR